MTEKHSHGGKPDLPKLGDEVMAMIDTDHKITDPNFDESEFYEAEIKPVLQKLIERCNKRQLPFICGVNFANDGNKGNGISYVAGLPGARTPMTFRIFTDAMQDKTGRVLKAMVIGAAMMRAAKKIHNDKGENENE